jgi:membrane protein insertase Oxa1/YidC/SpoIIIJ
MYSKLGFVPGNVFDTIKNLFIANMEEEKRKEKKRKEKKKRKERKKQNET